MNVAYRDCRLMTAILLAMLVICCGLPAFAQQPDSTFGDSGRVVLDIDGFADAAHAVGLQSDGKILVAGRTHTGPSPNDRDAVVVRFTTTGEVDSTFGSIGLARYSTGAFGCPGNPEWFFDLLVLDGDTFLAAGFDQRGCDAPARDFLVVRYQPDGTVDQVFNEYPVFYNNRDEAQTVALQPDGKVIAAGWAQTVSGNAATMDVAVARWNADGTLDTTFNNNGEWLLDVNGDMDRVNDVLVQPDGKIILIGQTTVGGQTDILVIRLNADGTLDTSFDGDGIFTLDHAGFNDSGNGLLLQNDGRLLVGGTISPDGTTSDAFVLRLNMDGTPDSTFGTNGIAVVDYQAQSTTGAALAWYGDKILIAGCTFDGTRNHFALARLLADGTLDTEFGTNGWMTATFDAPDGTPLSAGITDLIVQPDHRTVLVGSVQPLSGADDSTDIALVRFVLDSVATGIEDAAHPLPSQFALHQNYPNPFNPTTRIAFDLPRQARVQLTVYDLLGREVKRLLESAPAAGLHTVKVLVGLPNNEVLQTLLMARDARLAALEDRLAALEQERRWLAFPGGLAPGVGALFLVLLAGLVWTRRVPSRGKACG